jgi:hypothetical protein
MKKYVSNWEFFLNIDQYPHSTIVDIATAIKQICASNGIDNLRWHVIGDLIHEEIPLIDALTADGDFVVWSFTRRNDVLMSADFPRRDNVIFWCSVDPTMSERQLEKQIRAAELHDTQLAYATHIGLGTHSRAATWPPEKDPTIKKTQKYTYGFDPYLEKLYERGHNPSVVFGLHKSGHLTKVFSEGKEVLEGDECPATDPFGGGHFKGACQECGWCIRKPKFRSHKNLLEHRRKMVVDADGFSGKYDWGNVLLDTGKRR